MNFILLVLTMIFDLDFLCFDLFIDMFVA